MHLADAFIQSDLQAIHIFYQCVCSLGIEPTTFCAVNAMLYHWATGTPVKYMLGEVWAVPETGLSDIMNTVENEGKGGGGEVKDDVTGTQYTWASLSCHHTHVEVVFW